MDQQTFITERNKWLKRVAEQCHEFAYPPSDCNLDFYVFQSDITHNPDLLIIGSNPKGDKQYTKALEEKSLDKNRIVKKREGNDLHYNTNQYIQNPNWSIAKPMLYMFSNPKLRNILENSVIMNAFYFNTNGENDIKAIKGVKDIISFCKLETNAMIYNLIKPKNIIFNGSYAPKMLGIKFSNEDTVLKNDKGQILIKEKLIQKIPHFLIGHTSNRRAGGFNDKDSLFRKKEFFEKRFS